MISNRVNFLRGTVFPQTFSFFIRYEKNQKNPPSFVSLVNQTSHFIINFQLKFSFKKVRTVLFCVEMAHIAHSPSLRKMRFLTSSSNDNFFSLMMQMVQQRQTLNLKLKVMV